MNTVPIINGPYINAIAWISLDNYKVIKSVYPNNILSSTDILKFDNKGGIEKNTLLKDEICEIPNDIRKKSNVARSRSAARSTIFASLIAGELLQNNSTDRDKIGIACVSSTSSIPAVWEFETEGVKNGWDNTDTMLLPSSIPSAVATQTASAHNLHATALTFLDGLIGSCSAVEYSSLCLNYNRAEEIIVLCTEEICKPHLFLKKHAEFSKINFFNGAIGMHLTNRKNKDNNCQFKIIHRYSPKDELKLPESWNDPKVCFNYDLKLETELSAFTSYLLPFLINQLLNQQEKKKILIKCEQINKGFLLGIEME